MERALSSETVSASGEKLGSVIFLHGSSGNSVRGEIYEVLGQDLRFPSLQIHYPSAFPIPYTMEGGAIQRAWFDRLELELSSKEQLTSIDEMAGILDKYIEKEIQRGIPEKKIFIGGYSMGGAMALHVGLRLRPNLAGIFCLSSFLNRESKVYEDLRKRAHQPLPKVFMTHGDEDSKVNLEWGQVTRRNLESLGVRVTYHVIKGASHDIAEPSLILLAEWLSSILKEDENK